MNQEYSSYLTLEQNCLSNIHRGSPKEHSCELCQNPSTGLRKDVVLIFFLDFLALAAILFNGAEWFEQLW